MERNINFIISTSPQTHPARKPRCFANLVLRQQSSYGKPRRYNTGKERDSETGLYYYGARYLDPKTSRWLSGDPAVSEYVPSAPVSEEAKKRNGSLPGMGGVFNYANLHAYHYAGNNPVKYVDPDGNEVDKPKISFTLFNYEFIIFNKPEECLTPKLQSFLNFLADQGVTKQNPQDPFIFEQIADSWDHLPDDVKNFMPSTEWGKVSYKLGDHKGQQIRLPNGYHIAEEFNPDTKEFMGVYVHRDSYNALNGITENILHPLVEKIKASPVDAYKNEKPNWEEVEYDY